MVKSQRMRWVGHVASMGEECIQGFGRKTLTKEIIRNSWTEVEG
jgi:hypothetical protein